MCALVALPDSELSLRIEHARMAWEFALKEVDLHQQRLVQLFAVLLTMGLAAVGSVVLERVPPRAGLLFAAGVFAGAGYAHYQIGRLPRRLELGLRTGQKTIENLMLPRGR